ncbi:MAG: NAD(P)H-dependent glycerol-3-phosphate dehydrogenase [Eubacteriales bacterium]|nr:NAD(P)H-dependent glycerol-3-phosphate dehydrogenase [Eubacteriales bacterium]
MNIAVVGCGAWGTALAIRLCKNGHNVTMWSHRPERAAQMNATHVNPRLPGIPLPQGLNASSDLSSLRGCPLVVMATPSSPLRSVCRQVAPYLDENALLVSVTKGLEQGTHLRMSQVIAQETGRDVVVLTGPSHAEEVGLDMPTGCLAAHPDQEKAEFVQDIFMSDTFRVYTSPDAVGAELGAALKNVIALCAGIADGLGCGDNTKAMLMTRGLTETARLGVSLGARKETFAGLAGVGDLIVTCTSMHSRNRRAGILIGQGKSAEAAMAEVGAAVEGYYAARSAWELGKSQGINMPITEAAYQVLYEGADVNDIFKRLMTRAKKAESEDAGWL